jgi:BirA family biotin operon repressor/biotin-[acetyl-CoA-carboxylase] ligase
MQSKAIDLGKNFFGAHTWNFTEVDSTNLVAQEYALNDAIEGTIIQADKQIKGSGRMKRKWESPAGAGLWFSLILRPTIVEAYVAQVTLLTAVAMQKAIEVVSGVEAMIKWPNDLLVNNKKICGILAELMLNEKAIEYVILGIGVNTNLKYNDLPNELREKATSLFIETDKKTNDQALLQQFSKEFCELYFDWQIMGFEKVRKLWLEKNMTLGKDVNILSEDKVIFQGKVKTIDDYGKLIVISNLGEEMGFEFGEVSIRAKS